MARSPHYDEFVKAYNHFDSRPLSGEQLKNFYVDDLAVECTNDIIDVIDATVRFGKILIVGQRGCGKSTILNKVADDLNDKHHVVNFSVGENMNLTDAEAVDILFVAYLEVLKSVEKKSKLSNLSNTFKEFFKKIMGFIENAHKINEVDITIGNISFKLRAEPEFRAAIRNELWKQVKELEENLSEACQQIFEKEGKNVLIFIDDLDKLPPDRATQTFFVKSQLLSEPKVKIVYTFPLDAYYRSDFRNIRDFYTTQSIPLVNLYDVENKSELLSTPRQVMKKLIFCRIDKELVDDDALNHMIKMSGGVLRDLIKFMQDACFMAMKKHPKINQLVAENAVNKLINDFYRVFDFPKYATQAEIIATSNEKIKIDNNMLTELLCYLYVLEYQDDAQKTWYDVHPCLKKLLKFDKK